MKKFMYFIGAGTSKCCGVPDTATFLRLITQANPNHPEGIALSGKVKEIFQFITDFYTKIYGKTDLEYVYTKTIEYCSSIPKISSNDVDQQFILLKNFPNDFELERDKSGLYYLVFGERVKSVIANDRKIFQELRKKLEKLIYYYYWQTMQDDKIEQLNSLLGIIFSQYGIKENEWAVFTTNYDVCIDNYFRRWKGGINDGFESSDGFTIFNRDLLKFDTNTRLYKLHGSVDWIELEDNRIVKTEDRISLTREDYCRKKIKQRILIYPILDKVEYNDERINMIPDLEEWVREVNLIITVGYSYRDKVIRDTIFKNASESTKLVHISPNANDYTKLFQDFPGKFFPMPCSFPEKNIASRINSILVQVFEMNEETITI